MGIAGQPAQRFEQLAVEQRLRVGQGMGMAQFHAGGRGTDAHDHAGQLAVAERYPDPVPDQRAARFPLGGREVVEQPRHRYGEGDLETGGGVGAGIWHRSSLSHAPGGSLEPCVLAGHFCSIFDE